MRREEGCSTTLGAVAGDGMVAGAGEVAICIQVLLEKRRSAVLDVADPVSNPASPIRHLYWLLFIRIFLAVLETGFSLVLTFWCRAIPD